MFSDKTNTISNVKVFGIPPKLCGRETELMRLYKSNKTCSEIAKLLNGSEIAEQVHTHPISVYNKIRKMKLTRPQKWAEYTSTFKGKKELLLNMRQSGKNINEIATYFNVCPATVCYHLKNLEVSNA